MDFRSVAIAGLFGLAVLGYGATATNGQPRISAADAATRAQDRFDGAVLDVEVDDPAPGERATEVYEVRLITRNDAVIRVRIDAQTGAFLEAAGDNLIPAIKKPQKAQ